MRITLETAFLSEDSVFHYYILPHHYCWFSFVFLWFAVVTKHIAGLSSKKIPFLVFIMPIVFVPIVISLLTGEPLNLSYVIVSEEGVLNVVKNVFTLNYFHADNHEQFYELLALVILLAVGSFIISRNIKKTVAATVAGYFGSYLIAGIHWFGVNTDPRTSAVFLVPSSLKSHHAAALIYFSLSVIAFLILALPEFKTTFSRMFSEKSFVSSITLFLLWTIIFTMTFKRPTGREISAFDVVFTFIPLFVMLQYILTFKIQTSNQRILFGWIAIVGGFVLFPMLFGVY